MLSRAVVLAVALAVGGGIAGARAAGAPTDTLAVPSALVAADSVNAADSAAADSAGADSTGVGPARVRAGKPERVARPGLSRSSPPGAAPRLWWVTVRSGIVPGWGQLANRKPIKAVVLVGIDAWWLSGVLRYESDRKAAVRAGDATAASAAVDHRNFRIWMMGATALYAMLDAYVDAHFFDYDEGWTGRVGPGPAGQPEVRLAYRF